MWTAVLAIFSAIVSGGGTAVGIRAFANRKVTAANAVDQLTDSALELVKAARDEAREARQEAQEARREANEARREAATSRIEAMSAAADAHRLVTAILDPYATLESLRKIVTIPT